MVGQAGIAPARSMKRHLLYRQPRVFSGLLAQTGEWLRKRESNPFEAAYETAETTTPPSPQ